MKFHYFYYFILAFAVIILHIHLDYLKNILKDTTKKDFFIVTKTITPKKYTILSCSISGVFREQQYCFFLPITILTWKRIGYDCIVIISVLKDLKINAAHLKAIETIESLGVKPIIVEIKHDNSAMVRMFSMVSRLFSGAIDVLNDDDFVLTSDSDLIPIKNSTYHFESLDNINIINAFCCGNFLFKNKTYNMYPIGHIGMKKKYWRDVMKLDQDFKFNGGSVLDHLREKAFKGQFNESSDLIAGGTSSWYYDQVLVSVRISDYMMDNDTKILVKKFPLGGDRLDRAGAVSEFFWKHIKNTGLMNYGDAHLYRSPEIFQKWQLTQNLLDLILSEKDNEFIKKYFSEYKMLSLVQL
jgi:hypothetical protein